MLHKSPSDEQEVEAALNSKSSVSTQPRKAGIETGVISGPSPPSARLLSFSVGKLAFCRPARRGRREEQAPSGVT